MPVPSQLKALQFVEMLVDTESVTGIVVLFPSLARLTRDHGEKVL